MQNEYEGFEISGHADLGSKGKDVLCAAVSVLALHTALTIQEELHKEAETKESAGYLRFRIDERDEITEMLFRAFYKRVIELSEQYPGKIKVEVKE
jgi:uncharacterized protein YsxB (DUF464 family)